MKTLHIIILIVPFFFYLREFFSFFSILLKTAKMKRWTFLILLLIILIRKNLAFLNDAEQNISAGLMEVLNTDHRILVEEPSSKLKNLQIFKTSMFWSKATTYQNTNQILKYFGKKNFPDVKTLIILKVGKLRSAVNLLKSIANKNLFGLKFIAKVN